MQENCGHFQATIMDTKYKYISQELLDFIENCAFVRL